MLKYILALLYIKKKKKTTLIDFFILKDLCLFYSNRR